VASQALYTRLKACNRPFGDESRTLVLGRSPIRIEGLDADLAARLEGRWGGFLHRAASERPARCVRVVRGGEHGWLERWKAGESYRLEALHDLPQRLVASYHFALCSEPEPSRWRVAVTEQQEEPLERILENALRFVAADLAVAAGGFAMHAAAVLWDGRAYVFAGPSGAGKSTAVRLCAPAVSLGDDFGLVLPGETGWSAPAVPFDNSERVADRPAEGLFPVAGVWRLLKAPQTRVERPPPALAVASLLGCAAFPWAMPERAGALAEQVERFVAAGRYAHLHFAPHSGLLRSLAQGGGTGETL
jgi:hypothetical protein